MNFIANESAQKLRGGYYTPPPVARFLSRWVLEGGAKRILEPSCGDGVFVDALHQAGERAPSEMIACEIDANEASKAKRRARAHGDFDLKVLPTDFLGWALSRFDLPPEFDAVVGNPPFIRYQYLDPSLQRQSEKIFARFNLPFTKHTNAWVPFVMASLALLKPGGRLAMVVPSELLHVIHAQSLRRFLLERCSRLLVIDPEELMFGDALQGVVLLLAERCAEVAPRNGALAVTQVRTNDFLDESPAKLFRSADFVPGAALGAKWMLALLTQSERRLLIDAANRPKVHRFADVASVDVGIVTGANKFFLVTDAIVREFDLKQWAFPMFGRSNHVQGVIYDKRNHNENRAEGLPTNFLWFPVNEAELNDGARRYIRSGKTDELHTRYKCRIRTPWYRVPSVHVAPVGMLKRSHHFPRLVLNQARAFTTDTAYRIQPQGVTGDVLVGCFVNSLTALTAELEGRHYGGGVLELVPSEIERLLVPIPTVSGGSLLADLDANVRKAVSAETLLRDQDRKVLRPLGFRQVDCDDLLTAWSRIRHRRHRTQDEKLDDDEPAVAATKSRSRTVRADPAEARKVSAFVP